MATALQPGSTTNATNNRVVISVVLIAAVIGIIIFVACILHRIRPPIIVPASARNERVREEERYQKEIRHYVLESLPVVRYSMRVQPTQHERDSEIYDFVRSTYRPRRQAHSPRDIEKALHINAEVAVIARVNEHKKETTVKNTGTQDDKIGIAPEEDALQNKDPSGSRHEPISCSVCTDDFIESDKVRILPCGHIYHRDCIDPWLLDFAGTCPLCRTILQNVPSSSASLPGPPGPVLLLR